MEWAFFGHAVLPYTTLSSLIFNTRRSGQNLKLERLRNCSVTVHEWSYRHKRVIFNRLPFTFTLAYELRNLSKASLYRIYIFGLAAEATFNLFFVSN